MGVKSKALKYAGNSVRFASAECSARVAAPVPQPASSTRMLGAGLQEIGFLEKAG